MNKYQKFLRKLTEITEETGVHINDFGDPFYNPHLINEEDEDEYIWFSWDEGRYIARTGNPYDGKEFEY